MQSEQSLVKKFENIQLVLLINLCILSIIIFFLYPAIFNYYFQYYSLIILVAIVGLPHGFFDYSIAKKLFSSITSWLLLFTVGYVTISLVYFIAWNYIPLVSLILFLILAIYHFGMEELAHKKYSEMSITDILILGSIPVVFPVIFHTNEVFIIFEQIISQELNVIEINKGLSLFYFFLVIFKFYSNGFVRFLPYLFLIPSYILLPPLISFILYFCFHHSLKHYIVSIYEEKLVPDIFSMKSFLVTIVIASIIFTAFVVGMLVKYSIYTIDIIIVKYTFILLACLTLPHLLLNIFYETKK